MYKIRDTLAGLGIFSVDRVICMGRDGIHWPFTFLFFPFFPHVCTPVEIDTLCG